MDEESVDRIMLLNVNSHLDIRLPLYLFTRSEFIFYFNLFADTIVYNNV